MTPGAVNRHAVADKIDLVRRMLDGIRNLPLESLAAFREDRRTAGAGESYLRRALEALFDLSRHILSKGFGRAPAEYAEVARQLGEVKVVSLALAGRLELMARYRNRMVHFYDEITEEGLYGILTRDLGEVEEVIAAVTGWIATHPERGSRDG
jgi:uncharacterized protein YutE (UPF0331/DUF86 family)